MLEFSHTLDASVAGGQSCNSQAIRPRTASLSFVCPSPWQAKERVNAVFCNFLGFLRVYTSGYAFRESGTHHSERTRKEPPIRWGDAERLIDFCLERPAHRIAQVYTGAGILADIDIDQGGETTCEGFVNRFLSCWRSLWLFRRVVTQCSRQHHQLPHRHQLRRP